jgi:hypothetical protein
MPPVILTSCHTRYSNVKVTAHIKANASRRQGNISAPHQTHLRNDFGEVMRLKLFSARPAYTFNPLRTNITWIILIDNRTHSISFTKTNHWWLCTEIKAFYSKNFTRHTNALWRNHIFFKFQPGDYTKWQHWSSKRPTPRGHTKGTNITPRSNTATEHQRTISALEMPIMRI